MSTGTLDAGGNAVGEATGIALALSIGAEAVDADANAPATGIALAGSVGTVDAVHCC